MIVAPVLEKVLKPRHASLDALPGLFDAEQEASMRQAILPLLLASRVARFPMTDTCQTVR